LGFTIYFFKKDYKQYSPSYKFVKAEHVKNILGMGVKFFIIQIAGLIQFESVNFLIANYFGMYQVTAYNIAFKYFGVLAMVFNIIINPLWSAATDAYAKNDLLWIINAVKKYKLIYMCMIVLGLLMFLGSSFVLKLWLGKSVIVPVSLCFWMMIYVFSTMFSSIHVYILNGMGKLKLQFYICLISPILFILLSYLMVKVLHFGISSILIASILANFNGLLIAPLQYKKIINGGAGIWVK
jgi:O-antigen/teichoic acid export membrane protein